VRGQLNVSAAFLPLPLRQLVPFPVDPDLRDAASLGKRLARFDSEVGDLPDLDGPQSVAEPELPRRNRCYRRQRVVLRETAREHLAQAPVEVLCVVQAGRREGESQTGVLQPLRIGRSAVHPPQALERHVQPLRVVFQAVGSWKVHLEDQIGIHRNNLVPQAVLVSRADVSRLELEFLGDLSGAQQRKHVRRLEHGRFLSFGRLLEGRCRRVAARPRLADGMPGVGRLRVAPPGRVEQSLADHRNGSHPGRRVAGTEEVGEIEPLGLERDVLSGLAREDTGLHRLVGEADQGSAPAQDPRRRDRGDDRETEAPVGVGDALLDPERVDHAIFRMGRIGRRGCCSGGPAAARGLFRRLLVVGRPPGTPARQPIRRHVRIDEGCMEDLPLQIEDARVGRD
jgi:hypothetical protein